MKVKVNFKKPTVMLTFFHAGRDGKLAPRT